MTLLTKALSRLVKEVRSPWGYGRPVERKALDHEYASGQWDHFFGPDEQPRHEAFVTIISQLHPHPRLLDMGCGSGRLASMLSGVGVSNYLGVDISDEGLKRARGLNLPHGRFEQGDFETWRPRQSYDIITFNECLGYARDPRALLCDFSGHLVPGGHIVVSHFRWGNYRAVWRRMQETFVFSHEVTVASPRGQQWDLKALRPRSHQ